MEAVRHTLLQEQEYSARLEDELARAHDHCESISREQEIALEECTGLRHQNHRLEDKVIALQLDLEALQKQKELLCERWEAEGARLAKEKVEAEEKGRCTKDVLIESLTSKEVELLTGQERWSKEAAAEMAAARAAWEESLQKEREEARAESLSVQELKAREQALQDQVEELQRQAERSHKANRATTEELDSLRKILSSSALQEIVGIDFPDMISEGSITKDARPPCLLNKLKDTAPCFDSPARLKREAIANLSDEEILRRELGQVQQGSPSIAKEGALNIKQATNKAILRLQMEEIPGAMSPSRVA